MKIAIVTYSLEVGGAERVIFNLAKYFLENNHEVSIIETLKEGTWKDYFTKNQLLVISFPMPPFKSKKQHALKIAGALEHYDVIFLNDAPFAQSVLGLLRTDVLCFPILHMAVDSMIRNATSNYQQWNRIVVVSSHFVQEIIKHNPSIPEDEICCIPNGIKLPHQSHQIPKFNKKEGIRLIYLGRIEQSQKGTLLIPEIIEHLFQTVNIKEVNIFGDGPSMPELVKIIKEKNLDKIIICHGSIEHDKIQPLFSKHDFLLMPSYFEGHPITLLEAMANGVIPFVSNLHGMTDTIVTHGINGFLCEPGNSKSFAETILFAIEDCDLTTIARNAKQTIVEKFSSDTMGRAYNDLIDHELLSRNKINRSGMLEISLLGDFPNLPILLIKPTRKLLKLTGHWSKNNQT